MTLYVNFVDNVCVLQPQWLFHALTRAMQPKFGAIRWGRRYGEDPKENLLTFDAEKEAKRQKEQEESEKGLMAQRLAHRHIPNKPNYAVT